jgi:hypothetical protein
MTFFAAIVVLTIAASALLVFAGREVLRVNGYAPVRLRRTADLLHVMSLGYAALNEASVEATRRRIGGRTW